MTKRFLFTSVLAINTLFARAQHILRSDVIYKNEVHQEQYLFVRSDAKTVQKDWTTYLSKYGKVSEVKGEITIEKIKEGGLGSFVDHAVSTVRDEKDFAVISILFFDENNRSLDEKQIKKEGLEKMFYDFYDMAYFNEEIRMAEKDLEYANDLLKLAEKDKGKAERGVEANLRAQEKLGKKLSQSPEELSKIIQEKDAIYQELLKKTEVTEEKAALEKEMSEKDKEILKEKEKKDKNTERLSGKEEEFPKLTEELFAARKNLDKAKQVVESKKLVLQELKAKR